MLSALLLLCVLIPQACLFARADTDYAALAQERKELPIASNLIDNWPTGPAIGAEAALLMDASTGAILYSKNPKEHLYPASTTKLMTCLLAVENCKLDEIVSFSYDAVFSVPSDGSSMGIDPGESMPLEECLYGIMVGSANEVANAVAEHVAGSMDGFVELMNERAKELGCKDTHFVNANGIHDEEHYTCAYDLALIARAFFSNEILCNIGNTPRYHFEATVTQPDDFYKNNKHELITGAISYPGILGGKTGYTSQARQTLVTCAQKGTLKLICVILKEESPDQFYDTTELFDYGFTNFSDVIAADQEKNYNISSADFLRIGKDIFGNSETLLSLDDSALITLPNTITFGDIRADLDYSQADASTLAILHYSYQNVALGDVPVLLSSPVTVRDFTSRTSAYEETEADSASVSYVFLNIKIILLWISGISLILLALIFLFSALFHRRNSHRRRTARRKLSGLDDLTF
ncbi:MAG: D-alanyl-D-alanine carboxypeptidase [Lachnospiraceae bacterium]|nr:D-alanyl-D-alanine carboxypeptidase [Lachnospiraceae bacterium]